jgi:hypothetical protein
MLKDYRQQNNYDELKYLEFFSPPKMALPTWGSSKPHTAGARRQHAAAKLLNTAINNDDTQLFSYNKQTLNSYPIGRCYFLHETGEELSDILDT